MFFVAVTVLCFMIIVSADEGKKLMEEYQKEVEYICGETFSKQIDDFFRTCLTKEYPDFVSFERECFKAEFGVYPPEDMDAYRKISCSNGTNTKLVKSFQCTDSKMTDPKKNKNVEKCHEVKMLHLQRKFICSDNFTKQMDEASTFCHSKEYPTSVEDERECFKKAFGAYPPKDLAEFKKIACASGVEATYEKSLNCTYLKFDDPKKNDRVDKCFEAKMKS